MKRSAKAILISAIAIGVVAFAFFVPFIAMSEISFSLVTQHGGFCGYVISSIPLTSTNFYGSISYAAFRTGVVYIPNGSYFWWLPTAPHCQGPGGLGRP